jgi:hypothetical protein
MLDRLRIFLSPPTGANDAEHRLMQIQYVIVVLLFVFTLLLLFLFLLVGNPSSFDKFLILLALGVEALSFWFLKTGRLRASSLSMIYLLWATLMLSTLTSQGVSGTPVLARCCSSS